MRTLITRPSIKVCNASVSPLNGHPEPPKYRRPDNCTSTRDSSRVENEIKCVDGEGRDFKG